jgi:hypothetical protein
MLLQDRSSFERPFLWTGLGLVDAKPIANTTGITNFTSAYPTWHVVPSQQDPYHSALDLREGAIEAMHMNMAHIPRSQSLRSFLSTRFSFFKFTSCQAS